MVQFGTFYIRKTEKSEPYPLSLKNRKFKREFWKLVLSRSTATLTTPPSQLGST